MGSVCCCLHAEDFEDYMNSNNNIYRNCLCIGCFFQNFIQMCTTLLQRGELHSVPSSIQGTASMNSSVSLDNSLSDMYCSTPRPFPCDVDTRYFRLQRDGLVSRREKGSSHSQEESEPLRGEDDVGSDSLSRGGKWNACEQGSIEQHSKSSQLTSTKTSVGIGYIYSTVEEEDVCPTCLEEYTPENPKIITKCSHHFHLGCIYEWMERSEHCPVCGKMNVNDNNRR
ncbi:E3 ubiquitin-protein ligase At3g02290-like isoform X2 [Hibiscus syriacus]|uniref:E3 ubiquitin-protein ligase At3g02290-like isoform X2 n=1 Tax=Hibiscus syriacus TaxID=106335 RepID=UPI001921B488|nr:E3 ubiquitin-protein ligase At3g02290-like isoform X2 [Hibiscus syriacus]